MKILCDVDGVIADCQGAVHRAAESFFARPVPPISTWHVFDFQPCIGCTGDEYAEFSAHLMSVDNLGWQIELYSGAAEFIDALRRHYEVVFCTSQWSGMGCWVPARERLLNSHFPGCDIVFTHAKHHVRGQYLIDDKPSTVRHDYNKNRAMLFHQPWNAREADLDYMRVRTYADVLRAVGA